MTFAPRAIIRRDTTVSIEHQRGPLRIVTGGQGPRGLPSFEHVLTPAQITANQNDYNPTGFSSADVLRLSSDASRNITGLAPGHVLAVFNVGAQSIVLKNESSSSSAANRFALGADLTLTTMQGKLLWYDLTSSRWRAL